MDRAKEKIKPSWVMRCWTYIVIGCVLCIGFYGLHFVGQAGYTVDGDKLNIAQVKEGDFTVSVQGNGVLVPDDSQWLVTTSVGKVAKIHVKAGVEVQKGDIIVELANPRLQQQLEEAQWEYSALAAEVLAEQASRASSLLDQEAALLAVKLRYQTSKMLKEAHEALMDRGASAISRIEYERIRLETQQLQQQYDIDQKRYTHAQHVVQAQNNASQARLNRLDKVVQRNQQAVNNLIINATMAGTVLDMPLEIGQHLLEGSKVAQLVNQRSLIAELQLPEIQIGSIQIGQEVHLDTRNHMINGRVSRIDPGVVNGLVQVDVELIGELPKEARPALSVRGEIIIAEVPDALYTQRPLFAQSQSTSAIYKVTEDGHFAKRVPVSFGVGSVRDIQITQGLVMGDRIIISDSKDWQQHQVIRIN